MTSILGRLTDAMSAAAGTVRDEELRPLVTPRRRRRQPAGGRWRQSAWAAPVAAAAAVALVIGLAVSVSNGLFGTLRPAGPAHLPAAPRQFNPLIPYVSFGWLPAGESLISGGVRRTEVYLEAGAPAKCRLGAQRLCKGACHLTGSARVLKCSNPRLNGMALQLSGRAPAVRGHSAFWAGPNLVWQYARGGWAALTIPVPTFSALRQDPHTQRQAIKIADHIRFGAATPPLVFPAQLTGLTSQWRISDVYYLPDSAVLRAESYMLTTGASRFSPHAGDLGVWVNAPYVEIHPAPRGSTCTPTTRPRRTPARSSTATGWS